MRFWRMFQKEFVPTETRGTFVALGEKVPEVVMKTAAEVTKAVVKTAKDIEFDNLVCPPPSLADAAFDSLLTPTLSLDINEIAEEPRLTTGHRSKRHRINT